jgi:hypothetical protein
LTVAVAAVGLAWGVATGQALAQGAPQPEPRQIRIEYEPPKSPAHQSLYEQLKQARALEQVQDLMSPIRLPKPLLYKLAGCDGEQNAWYEDEVITVCYELLQWFVKSAPSRDLAAGLRRSDAIIGPSLDTVLHETGHALFHMLKIPVLGREEDAADQFSAYIILQLDKDEARRMLLGAAYGYKSLAPNHHFFIMRTKSLANEHSLPGQRLFNLLCMAYGADKTLFADVVEKKFLPEERAERCADEYESVAFSFRTLLAPHFDQALAMEAYKTWAQGADARRARLKR